MFFYCSRVSIENFHSGRELDNNFDSCRSTRLWAWCWDVKGKATRRATESSPRAWRGVESSYWSDSNVLNLDSFGMGSGRGPASRSNLRIYLSLHRSMYTCTLRMITVCITAGFFMCASSRNANIPHSLPIRLPHPMLRSITGFPDIHQKGIQNDCLDSQSL